MLLRLLAGGLLSATCQVRRTPENSVATARGTNEVECHTVLATRV